MATRSYIGMLLPNGKVRAIYCHSDSYPEHHGPILLNHYNTQEKVEQLIKLGALSVLGSEIGKKHCFGFHWDLQESANWCLAYRRDRGDSYPSTKPTVFESWWSMDCQYNYLFKDGMWWLVNDNDEGTLTDLRSAIITKILT